MTRNPFFLLLLVGIWSVTSCKKTDDQPVTPGTGGLYFPPIGNTDWQTTAPGALSWNEPELAKLYPYLESKSTKAFIVLKDGKIVVEKYFGTFKQDSLWYWASAGKTMTGFLVGIAQKEGLLSIDNKTSQYLGTGWTSLPAAKENLITVKNQLTMTTGLDDSPSNSDCTLPACLQYKADAGTRWAYHNAPYTLLDKVVENASKMSYNAYYQQKVRDRIGMNGGWLKTPNSNNVLYSNARSMARFGLLLLNKGKWADTPILDDETYFTNQTNTSQNFNLSYGYLTWLNGKSSVMFPTSKTVFPTSLIPNAPADLYAALGKNDQKIYVVPSQNIVVIRMGNAADASLATVTGFDNELWGKLKLIIR